MITFSSSAEGVFLGFLRGALAKLQVEQYQLITRSSAENSPYRGLRNCGTGRFAAAREEKNR